MCMCTLREHARLYTSLQLYIKCLNSKWKVNSAGKILKVNGAGQIKQENVSCEFNNATLKTDKVPFMNGIERIRTTETHKRVA